MRTALVYDKSIFNAGSKVSGSLFFEVDETIDIDSIKCTVRGKEKTSLKESVASQVSHVSSNIFFRIDKTTNGEKVMKGFSYSLPFEIHLPENIPPSLFHQVVGTSASVYYSVKFEIQSSQGLTKQKKHFQVDAFQPSLGVSHLKRKLTFINCSVLRSDEVGFDFSQSQHLFHNSDMTYQTRLTIENPSDVTVFPFKVNLIHSLTVNALGHKETNRHFKGECDVEKPQGEQVDKNQEYIIPIPFAFPCKLPSLKTPLIDSSYFLELEFSRRCSQEEEIITVPVRFGGSADEEIHKNESTEIESQFKQTCKKLEKMIITSSEISVAECLSDYLNILWDPFRSSMVDHIVQGEKRLSQLNAPLETKKEEALETAKEEGIINILTIQSENEINKNDKTEQKEEKEQNDKPPKTERFSFFDSENGGDVSKERRESNSGQIPNRRFSEFDNEYDDNDDNDDNVSSERKSESSSHTSSDDEFREISHHHGMKNIDTKTKNALQANILNSDFD